METIQEGSCCIGARCGKNFPPLQAQVSIISCAGMTIYADAFALVHNGCLLVSPRRIEQHHNRANAATNYQAERKEYAVVSY